MFTSITTIPKIPTSIGVAISGTLVEVEGDLGQGIDQGHGLVLAHGQVHVLALEHGQVHVLALEHGQGHDLAQEHGLVQDQVQDQVRAQVQDQARDKNQVQWIESRHQGNQAVAERVTRVPLVAINVVRLHKETVIVVSRVAAANQVLECPGVQ